MICNITDEVPAQGALLMEQIKYTIALLVTTIIRSFDSFREILSSILNIDELPMRLPTFLINVIARIPIELICKTGLPSVLPPYIRGRLLVRFSTICNDTRINIGFESLCMDSIRCS